MVNILVKVESKAIYAKVFGLSHLSQPYLPIVDLLIILT